MDMAADLRSRMAQQQRTVADVARLICRTDTTVSRYRMGHESIPLTIARKLYAEGLLSAESILGIEAAA